MIWHLQRGQAISVLAALLLILAALTLVDRGAEPAAAHPGVVSASPAGEWVTSTWPTTRYYTSRGRVDVWAAWAAGNRVWFESERGLLARYPGRERR